MTFIPLRYLVADAINTRLTNARGTSNAVLINPDYSPPDPTGDTYRGSTFLLVALGGYGDVLISFDSGYPEIRFCGTINSYLLSLLNHINAALQPFLPPEEEPSDEKS
jgi:hypothetical protein